MCKLVRCIFSSLQNFDAIALSCDAGIKAQYSKYEGELRYWQIRIVMYHRCTNYKVYRERPASRIKKRDDISCRKRESDQELLQDPMEGSVVVEC
jgi:hypothetical protein